MKLYEVLSEQIGSKFNISVEYKNSEGKTEILSSELTLDRFSLETLAYLESKYNVSMDQLDEVLTKKLVTVGLDMAWFLLKEKNEFNNDIKLFRKAITFENLQTLGDALKTAIEKGLPEAKN